MTEGSEYEARSKCQDISVQCTPSTSDVNMQFAFSDSDMSAIEVNKQQYNQSYIPSNESCLSYV